MNLLDRLRDEARDHFDLTEVEDRRRLTAFATALLESSDVSSEDLAQAAREPGAPLELKLAAKLVESRRKLALIREPLELGIVFAMWGEQRRLLPKTEENPTGEDLLRVKLDQLAWAFEGTPVRWTLYPVDDGCPHASGQIAARIASGHPLRDHVRVLELADAIPAREGPLRALASVDASRKGGAVLLGCRRALDDGAQAVVYTDADNSVHLGQMGLLLEPWAAGRVRVVLGNRKDPDSVLVKQEGRWGIGIKLLRHMQRRIGQAIFARGIGDTQAAFKLYQRDVLLEILERPTVFDFSFDTDWLAAVIAMGEPFECIPFAFIDSFEESASITQGPMTTWLMLLQGLAAAVRARGLLHDEAMARVLDEEIRDATDLERLIDKLPAELMDTRDEDLGQPGLMEAEAVRAWIRSC